MPRVISILLASISTWFRSRLALQLELIALRHQVAIYKQRNNSIRRVLDDTPPHCDNKQG